MQTQPRGASSVPREPEVDLEFAVRQLMVQTDQVQEPSARDLVLSCTAELLALARHPNRASRSYAMLLDRIADAPEFTAYADFWVALDAVGERLASNA